MRVSFAKCVCLSILAVVVSVSPARAQQRSPDQPSQLTVAYSHLREGPPFEHAEWDRGVQIEYAHPIRWTIGPAGLALIGDIGWHRNEFFDDAVTSYLGGARATFGHRSIEPFVQFLVGVERCCSNRGLAVQPGGGVNLWLARRLAVRIQLDGRVARYTTAGVSTNFNEARVGLGAVVALGQR